MSIVFRRALRRLSEDAGCLKTTFIGNWKWFGREEPAESVGVVCVRAHVNR